MQPITYPEDIQCVYQTTVTSRSYGRIFIGNLEAAQNLNTLKKNSIRAVVSVAKGAFLQHTEEDLPSYLYIPAEDVEHYQLAPYFEKACEFIDRNLPYTNILVHCMAGVSRSVTIVLAYMIKNKGYSFTQAYTQLKAKRHIINPNMGFVSQLKRLEMRLGAGLRAKTEQGSLYYDKAKLIGSDRLNPEKSRGIDYGEYYKYFPRNINAIEDKHQLEMQKHTQYLQERINKLREEAINRRLKSKSPIKSQYSSPKNFSPYKSARYDSPGKPAKYDDYRMKGISQHTNNINRMLRSHY